MVLAHFTKEVEFLGLRVVWVPLSLPPSLQSYIFGAFEKIKCIFFIVPVGSLEKSREKHSPDAGVGSTGRCLCASGEVTDFGVCELSTPDAGTERGQDTVCASDVR